MPADQMSKLPRVKDELLPPNERAALEDLYGKVVGPLIDKKLEAKALEMLARYKEAMGGVLSELLGPDDRDARLISRQSAAELLGVSLSTIKRMEASGELPEPVKFGEHTD